MIAHQDVGVTVVVCLVNRNTHACCISGRHIQDSIRPCRSPSDDDRQRASLNYKEKANALEIIAQWISELTVRKAICPGKGVSSEQVDM